MHLLFSVKSTQKRLDTYSATILDPERLKTFWITFEGNKVRVGENERVLMTGSSGYEFPVTHIAFSTMFDMPGLFYLPCKLSINFA